jgi:hypothetical protein
MIRARTEMLLVMGAITGDCAMRSRHPSGFLLWLCGILFLAPMSASGATLYSAEAHAFSGSFDSDSGPTPVSATTGDLIQTPHSQQFAQVSVSAGLSLAGAASANAFYFNNPPCCSFSAGATGTAGFSGYGVILSGPSGDSTLTSLNLMFDGTAGVSIGASLNGPSGTSTDGWGGPGPLALVTSPLLVSAGDVITIGLSLAISASCSTDPLVFGATCSASSNALSFSFPFSGPVFNLPAGWTANSVDGTIVNNAFVPEPATAILLVGGLTVLARRGTTARRRW